MKMFLDFVLEKKTERNGKTIGRKTPKETDGRDTKKPFGQKKKKGRKIMQK